MLAVPLTWIAMEKWLTGFSYRIDIQLTQPALAVMITLVVGFLTIGVRSWKASQANPVESLRVE